MNKKIFLFILFMISLMVFKVNTYAVDVTTFEELKNAISNASDNDEIVIKNDIEFTSTIGIAKNIKITGESRDIKITRTAGTIYVYDGYNVNISNLTFDGGSSKFKPDLDNQIDCDEYVCLGIKNNENGVVSAAFIDSHGNLTLNNVIIKNVYNKNDTGGAVRQNGGNLTILNSTIDHNLSSEGAGVHVTGAEKVVMKNNTFSNNYAYNASSTSSTMGSGAGVWMTDVPNLTAEDNTFESNVVSGSSGGAFLIYLNGNLTNNYEFNRNKYINNAVGNDGTAIHINSKTGTRIFINTTINFNNENYNKNNGLAKERQHVGTVSTLGLRGAKVNFNYCNFSENIGGAAVYGEHDGATLVNFNHCKFMKNTGQDLFTIRYGEYLFDNCTFEDNTASAIYGIASHLISGDDGNNVTINNSVYKNNNAAIIMHYVWYAVAQPKPARVNINNTKILNNNSDKYGIINADGLVNINIDDKTEIANNKAPRGGAIFVKSQSVVNLNNTKIHDNKATIAGDDIYLDESGTINLYDVKKQNLLLNDGVIAQGVFYDGQRVLKDVVDNTRWNKDKYAIEYTKNSITENGGFKIAYDAKKIPEKSNTQDSKNEEKNPNTFDKFRFIAILTCVSLITIIELLLLKRKNIKL